MNRNPVQSSNIKSMGYDPTSKTLEIEFSSGTVYAYPNVPPETYEAMTKAKSVGSFFATSIRNSFKGAKVPPAEKAPA